MLDITPAHHNLGVDRYLLVDSIAEHVRQKGLNPTLPKSSPPVKYKDRLLEVPAPVTVQGVHEHTQCGIDAVIYEIATSDPEHRLTLRPAAIRVASIELDYIHFLIAMSRRDAEGLKPDLSLTIDLAPSEEIDPQDTESNWWESMARLDYCQARSTFGDYCRQFGAHLAAGTATQAEKDAFNREAREYLLITARTTTIGSRYSYGDDHC